MCSLVRVGSPKGLEPPKELGTSLEPGTALLLERSALGGMTMSERNCPLSLEVGFNHEGKDDLGQRRVVKGTKSPTECRLRVGLGKEDSPWRESNTCEERMASPGTKSPLSKGLEMRLKRQTTSRTLTERRHGGVSRVSSQETKPAGLLPERVVSETESLPGRTGRPPLENAGLLYANSQALGSRRSPVASVPESCGASVEEQPVWGVGPRQELEKEPTCVAMKSSAEMKLPVGSGLPQQEQPIETKSTEPHMGSVVEPPECQFAQQPEEEKEPDHLEPGLEPPDCIRPIYYGKFFDRMPCWPTVSLFPVLSLGTMYSHIYRAD